MARLDAEPDEGALLAFRIADRRFALDAARVTEVAQPPALTRVPYAPASLAGVASVRGKVLPVIALGELLGVAAGPEQAARVIILGGGEPIGLAVDEVIGLEAGGGTGLVETADGAAHVVPLEQLLETAFGERRRRTIRAAAAVPERAEIAAQAEVPLLAFSLAGQPYALPLEGVREVIATPSEIAALPRTDAAMLGVTSWRGALTPVVSTRVLLGLPPADLTAAARVVIAIIGEARIGLAVDEVTAILRARPDAIGPVPRVLNRGAGEARVQAMLRTAGGGLVAILDAEKLFTEESVAQILEDGRGAAVEEAAEPAGVQRFLIFQLGAETYGMDIAAVQEVAALPENLARVPRAPDYVLGVMNLRGAVVPVIDQRLRFGVAGAAPRARAPRVLVTPVGDLVAGFVVDAVSEILEAPADALAPTPELTRDGARVFDRVARLGESGQVVLLVNPRELLDRAERDLLAALAADAAPA